MAINQTTYFLRVVKIKQNHVKNLEDTWHIVGAQ